MDGAKDQWLDRETKKQEKHGRIEKQETDVNMGVISLYK